MTIEKVHQKLQAQASALITDLQSFTEPNIQPCVEECEKIQQQLVAIQESISVYKFQKSNKEISPSFNIHAKVSTVISSSPEPEKPIAPDVSPVTSAEPVREIVQPAEAVKTTPVTEAPKTENKSAVKPLSIGINDKFRFINELFLHNAAEYNIAVEQINNLHSPNECDMYLSSLKELYHWSEQNDVVKLFFAFVKKRFD